jgi:hypothetical protein
MSPASPAAELSERTLARAGLTYLAEPGDPALGALLGICEPEEILAAIKANMLPGSGPGCGDSPASRAALERALGRWRIRLPKLPGDADIAGACRAGIRLVCPEDPDWPGDLDQLGQARPYALWLRGKADLRHSCQRSVSVVGSRAAALTPPPTAARWPPKESRSRCWPAGLTSPIPQGTRNCSRISRLTARWSASGRRAASPRGCGSWSATGSSPR